MLNLNTIVNFIGFQALKINIAELCSSIQMLIYYGTRSTQVENKHSCNITDT